MASVDMPRWMWELAGDYPFSPPPEGVVPNFEHPNLVGYHSITIACGICMFLLCAFSSARLYAKLRLRRKTEAHDYLFWISLPLLLLVLCLYIYLDNNGAYGYHAYEFKLKQLTKPILVVTFLSTIFLPVATCSIKITLFCLILAAFRPVTKLRYLCFFGIFLACGYYFANIVISIHSCYPRGGHDRIGFLAGMASKACASTDGIVQRASITTGVFNVLTDIYLIVIPIPAVRTLHISTRKKWGIFLIFSSGGLGVIASICSMAFRIRSYRSTDLTVATIPAMTCNMIEISIGLILTCLGPVWKLFRDVLSKHHPPTIGSSNATGQPYRHLAEQGKPRRHQRGGLSEIDSMKTFGTTVDYTSSHDATGISMKTLTSIEAH